MCQLFSSKDTLRLVKRFHRDHVPNRQSPVNIRYGISTLKVKKLWKILNACCIVHPPPTYLHTSSSSAMHPSPHHPLFSLWSAPFLPLSHQVSSCVALSSCPIFTLPFHNDLKFGRTTLQHSSIIYNVKSRGYRLFQQRTENLYLALV